MRHFLRAIEEQVMDALCRREFMQRTLALGLGGQAGLTLALAACRSRSRSSSAADGEAAPPELGPIERELHIYNWADYMPEETVPNFEKEFGVKVTYDTYETNEEMVINLRAGVKGYDLVVPTGWQLRILAEGGLLHPLSRAHLTNWNHLSPLFLRPPANTASAYGVPYVWGITGIAYRRDKVKEPVRSWGVFLDRDYAGRMTMLNERREVIGAMLRYRGRSLNSTDPFELGQAQADALAAKRNLRDYLSVQVRPYLLSGDVWVAQLYNGAVMRLSGLDPAIAFALPREGAAIWCDFICVPKGAPNPRAAHEFINYLLRPDVGARLAEVTGYGSPNNAATRLIEKPIPYPTSEEFRRLEYQVDLGPANALWDRVWAEIRNA
ncbi:MAG TPA: spermidine/putrescine ABC transporter substrate-binding protein [Gemmatimonadales bacterium]|nr:spermidine/putrescine ABC transporter substrate-binding protein [Gemmatimonadales bacterium]